jgi:hypothetical protein
MDISRFGVFAFLDAMDGAKTVDFARAVSSASAIARSGSSRASAATR